MRRTLLAIGAIAGALLLCRTSSWAQIQPTAAENIEATFTDASIDNDINTTSDPANYSYSGIGSGVTEDGRFFNFNANVEYGNPIVPPINCPANLVEYPFIPGGILLLGFNNGDQLFLQMGNTSYECGTAVAPYIAYTVASGTVIGGEGHYAKATGSWSTLSHGGILRIDSAGHSFGNDTGTLKASVQRH